MKNEIEEQLGKLRPGAAPRSWRQEILYDRLKAPVKRHENAALLAQFWAFIFRSPIQSMTGAIWIIIALLHISAPDPMDPTPHGSHGSSPKHLAMMITVIRQSFIPEPQANESIHPFDRTKTNRQSPATKDRSEAAPSIQITEM